ncbi:efflux transporter outer membrane subunit [Halopseudomonas pertucinogena]|uniref:RND transporter n=1 Tax=Halopseudomonas pertucinogena TaxID=86175 RepID=A0ABQ2CN02_9GAMM|nr:efflux transporter outer membrane subunit [Halopseudomonas pertucinogena]GGI96378.1 RND transporter [Halopseudomonas pertucinogena]
MNNSAVIFVLSAALLVSACTLGPDYQRPDTIDTSQLRHQDGWQPVPERSWAASGSWWQAFGDETLVSLIEQSQSANQTLAQAEARYRAAEAQWRLTRGELVPEVGASVSASRGGGNDRSNSSQYDARLQIGWAPDLWGRVRRSIEADQAGLQASAADLAAARLAIQVAVADSYIRLRALDRQQAILRDTLAAFERSATLTRNQYGAGIVSRSDVIQAETQLQSVRTDMYDLQAARAREQNALAALLGVAPVGLALAEQDGLPAIPTLPRSLPAVLIARRPDVVAAERQVAAANARIGVAQAAWLPDVTLDLWGGVQSGSFSGLFDAPARVWSLGPSLAQTIFDGGRREATRDIAVARYDEQAAFYRQTVIDGLRELEDALATLQILSEKADQQAELLDLAEENERVVNNRYRAGQVSFLEVATAQNITLSARRVAVDIHAERLAATVQLAAIIGGGWDLDDPVVRRVVGE